MVDNVTSAIVESGLIAGMGIPSKLPSKHRWGTCTQALAEQSAGFFFNNILTRAFMKAFPSWENMEAAADEGEEGGNQDGDMDAQEYRKMLRRKVWRATKTVADPVHREQALMTSLVMVPMDALWMKLQWLDERGSAMFDCVSQDRSPFVACQRSLASFMSAQWDEGPLFMWYFAFSNDDPEKRESMMTAP